MAGDEGGAQSTSAGSRSTTAALGDRGALARAQERGPRGGRRSSSGGSRPDAASGRSRVIAGLLSSRSPPTSARREIDQDPSRAVMQKVGRLGGDLVRMAQRISVG
jgi:hypothetical protein